MRKNTERLLAQNAMFNRHAVIHRLRFDYDTEENSLVCMALLEFIRSIGFLFEVIS